MELNLFIKQRRATDTKFNYTYMYNASSRARVLPTLRDGLRDALNNLLFNFV